MTHITKTIFNILNILAWITFVGLCIKAGTILCTSLLSLFINPEAAKNLQPGLNLSALYKYSMVQFAAMLSMIILLAGLKAFIFYLVINMFKKLNHQHQLSTELSIFNARITCIVLVIGLLTAVANNYTDLLINRGVSLKDVQEYLGSGNEFLLLGVILFFTARFFKKGIEIQSDNELSY
jgi:hypothetical protein